MTKSLTRSYLLILLFAGTLFTSASLLFVLQPLFGKILLPLLGGSPAVWNTCMVFYQTLLFLGYYYAHFLATRCNPSLQVLVHIGVLLLSLLALPIALSANTTPPVESNPTLWLFSTLLFAIGLPFFVLSTTAPLIQKWFAGVGHANSDDPYFLYAASNIGSLLALLCYPFVIEPMIGLTDQRGYWSVGYKVLCLLIAVCAWLAFQNKQYSRIEEEVVDFFDSDGALPLKQQLHWLVLAFVPSSLLLGLSNFISTDIASVPLLWIIPLTVYLLSFVIVFSKWGSAIHPWMLRAQALFLVPFITYAFINPADLPYWAYLVLHVIAFFFAVMVCHGELAKRRPHTQHLTTFYLIMSLAGMLGGMFNTFIAPFLFNNVYEYPLMIVAALLLRPRTNLSRKEILLQLVDPSALLVIGLVLYLSVANLIGYFDGIVISLILLTIASYFARHRALAYAGLNGVLILLALGLHGLSSHTLFQDRTFFGVLSIRESELVNEKGEDETYRELFHGTTKHGAQRLAANLSKIPLTYYSQPGPMGQLFKEYDKVNSHWNIGVVGLGAGALACYAKAEQSWTLYEIDPLVVEIAKNPVYFTYLSQCAPTAKMRIGDARLSLDKDADATFDLLVLDAFSSDAVPTHLLTREALELYFAKLKPNGILAFHITNRHLQLKKVLSIHAETLHFAALLQEFEPTEPPLPLVIATDWVAMAKDAKTLEPLRLSRLGLWQTMPLYFDMKPWTDDYSNIIGIWK